MATPRDPVPMGVLTAEEERTQLQMLTEFAPDAVVVMDDSGRVVEWNPSAEQTFGWSREEAVGSMIGDLIVIPRFRGSFKKWMDRFGALDEHQEITERVRLLARRRDDTEVPVEATIWTVAPSAPGERRLCNAFLRDLTELEEAQQMQARLAAIVDSSEDAIIGTNYAGVIVTWNQGAERLYGYAADEVMGRHVSLVVPPDRMKELHGIMTRLRRGEVIEHFDTVRVAKSGARIDVSLSLSPNIGSDGRMDGASSIARDITQRKRLEEASRRLNEELEDRVEQRTAELARANERLEALVASKTDFVASVSHELRTPLTSVIGFAELLMDSTTQIDPDQRQGILAEIADQGYELANIVEDLLVAARTEIGDLNVSRVPVNLKAQTAQVLETMRTTAGRAIEIEGDPRFAVADPQRVRQILRNLVTNAIRYGGPEIVVTLHAASEGLVGIAVCDNGEGIPEEARDAIFDRYTRAHDRPGLTESFGLGLAISRELARLMGGDLVYNRTVLTEFRLLLPLDPERS
jgi:PAS domain S-box-containing protein